jgi:hypothetical protein
LRPALQRVQLVVQNFDQQRIDRDLGSDFKIKGKPACCGPQAPCAAPQKNDNNKTENDIISPLQRTSTNDAPHAVANNFDQSFSHCSRCCFFEELVSFSGNRC